MPPPRILIIDSALPVAGELAGIAAELANAGVLLERASGLEGATGLSTALARMSDDAAADLVLLPESRPGVWTDRELEVLRPAAPLVRVLRVSGSWCEGQNRSGRPAAGSWGIAWHRGLSLLHRALGAQEGLGVLAAPLTATGEDLLLASCRPEPRRPRREAIAVHAPRRAQAEAWSALCQGLGYRALIAAADSPCEEGAFDAVLWDCEPRDLADEPCVRGFVDRVAPAPVLAVCGFPRPSDVETAMRHGVAAVLAKPLWMADVEWHLSRLFGARAAEG